MERRKANRGRPKKGQELGERVQLGLRVTPDVKKKLDQAAARSGRSLSQEAEFRLERTFAEDYMLAHTVTAHRLSDANMLRALKTALVMGSLEDRMAALATMMREMEADFSRSGLQDLHEFETGERQSLQELAELEESPDAQLLVATRRAESLK